LSKGALVRVTGNEGGIKVEKPHRQAQMHQLGNFKCKDKRGSDKKPIKFLTNFCIS
jgi:hypothetical protein